MSRREEVGLVCVGLALAILAACQFTPRSPRRTGAQVERDSALATYHKAGASPSGLRDTSYLDHRGYFNTFANYAVAFVDRDNRFFIDEDWELDNWGCEDARFDFCGALAQKKGLIYWGKRFVDRDADGTPEEEWEHFFDLKLTNKKDSSEIWVSTYDLPPGAKETLLEVFLANYADSLAGTELQVGGDPRGYAAVKQRKFVTTVATKEEISLGRYEALQADIVISDIDKLRLDGDHVHAMVRVVIARVDCDSKLMTYDKTSPRGIVTTSGKALMVIGYSNSPDFFESNVEAYSSFLKRFVFKKAKGAEGSGARLAPDGSV